jgi:hypothetical protein
MIMGIPSIVFWDICGRFWDTEKWQKSESSPVKQAKDFTGQGKQKVKIRISERGETDFWIPVSMPRAWLFSGGLRSNSHAASGCKSNSGNWLDLALRSMRDSFLWTCSRIMLNSTC